MNEMQKMKFLMEKRQQMMDRKTKRSSNFVAVQHRKDQEPQKMAPVRKPANKEANLSKFRFKREERRDSLTSRSSRRSSVSKKETPRKSGDSQFKSMASSRPS